MIYGFYFLYPLRLVCLESDSFLTIWRGQKQSQKRQTAYQRASVAVVGISHGRFWRNIRYVLIKT